MLVQENVECMPEQKDARMCGKLTKKLFEPLETPVSIDRGNGRRVSYVAVKRYADGLKEIALKKRTSIAAVLNASIASRTAIDKPAVKKALKKTKAKAKS